MSSVSGEARGGYGGGRSGQCWESIHGQSHQVSGALVVNRREAYMDKAGKAYMDKAIKSVEPQLSTGGKHTWTRPW